MDAGLMHMKIAARADEFLRTLLGDSVKTVGPGKWRVGTHGSLSIEIKNGRLVFFDHEAGTGGDAVDLVARIRDCGLAEALRECAAAIGESWQPTPNPAPQKSSRPKRLVRPRRVLPDITAEAAAAWNEGEKHLVQSPKSFNDSAVAEVASWRGWPAGFVRTLVNSGLFAMPLYYGHRTRGAFRTCEPNDIEPADGNGSDTTRAIRRKRDRQRWVGWHARGQDGWRFFPHRAQGGKERPALPPLPLILSSCGSDLHLWDKRIIIVTEGEWDAATIALAAGWWDESRGELRIPPAVAIVGIVGAGFGSEIFTHYYKDYFAPGLRALVFRDNDAAGRRWLEPGGFIQALIECGVRVASQPLGAPGLKVDVNDLYRAGRLTPTTLDAIFLRSLDLSLADVESMPPAMT